MDLDEMSSLGGQLEDPQQPTSFAFRSIYFREKSSE
jgi:hypothetical protein